MASRQLHQDKMYEIITQWKQSGLSQKQYCKQHAIPYSVFRYWHKHYRNRNNTSDTPAGSFVQLQMNEQAHQPFMEVLGAGGSRIIFYQAVSSDYVKSLIS